MKAFKTLLKISYITIIIGFFIISTPAAKVYATAVNTPQGMGLSDMNDTQYQLLTPLPGASTSTTVVNAANPVSYVEMMFELVISVAVVLAVFMLVYGGIVYMTTDNIHNKQEGKVIVQRTLIGFLILISSYIILQTINPNLVNINKFVTFIGYTPGPVYSTASSTDTNILPSAQGWFFKIVKFDNTSTHVTWGGPYTDETTCNTALVANTNQSGGGITGSCQQFNVPGVQYELKYFKKCQTTTASTGTTWFYCDVAHTPVASRTLALQDVFFSTLSQCTTEYQARSQVGNIQLGEIVLTCQATSTPSTTSNPAPSAPTITLKGDYTVTIPLNGTFTDPGYTVTYSADPNPTVTIESSGTVTDDSAGNTIIDPADAYANYAGIDTGNAGTYYVQYNMKDKNGDTDFDLRTVIVGN